ncbi:uncharacterized protein [Venturia canescens]|uniref:uncharacterized protein isoform X2 n=1 Tax=Venturia canescens TaxID=32260 RepID=UPI001C9CE6AA|nr:uncharacterized protein LOC122416529 isoform X2 [Venturia canescens]
MSDESVRSCILGLLRLTKPHSAQLRRRCNDLWCYELLRLSGDRLVNRLKYVIWWAPLRALVVAYNRGILSGQRVLGVVYEELQRRGVLEAPRVRGLVDEIRCKYHYLDKSLLLAVSNTAAIFTIGYRQFYDAGSDEEEALAEATRAVEETDLERQTALYQPLHEEGVGEEPRASTSAAPAEPIPQDFTIGYRQFYDAVSDEEEEALAEATRAVEEADLEHQTALYQPQHEKRAEEEPRASTSAASAEPIPLQPDSDDDEASTILNPSLMFSDRSDILAVYRQATANDDDGAIAGSSYHHHRQQEDDLVQPENQLGVYPMDAQQEEEEERLNEERLEARRFGLWFQELMECDSGYSSVDSSADSLLAYRD